MAEGLRSLPNPVVPTAESEEERLARKATAMGLTYAARDGGGLNMNDPTVAKSIAQISEGKVDLDTVKIWQKRNPRVAGVYGRAFDNFETNRKAKESRQRIISGGITPAQEARSAVPSQGMFIGDPSQPQMMSASIPERQASEASFDPRKVLGQFAQQGLLTPESQKLVGDVADQFGEDDPFSSSAVRGVASPIQIENFIGSKPVEARPALRQRMLEMKRAGKNATVATDSKE